MKVQYCHLIGKKFLDSEVYYVAHLDFSYLFESEKALASWEKKRTTSQVALETKEPYAGAEFGVPASAIQNIDEKYQELKLRFEKKVKDGLISEEDAIARLENFLKQAKAYERHKFKPKEVASRYTVGSHGVNMPRYRFLKWLYEYLLSETGELYLVASKVESIIDALEKTIVFEDKKWKVPLSKIYIYAHETRQPVGELTYKIIEE